MKETLSAKCSHVLRLGRWHGISKKKDETSPIERRTESESESSAYLSWRVRHWGECKSSRDMRGIKLGVMSLQDRQAQIGIAADLEETMGTP